MKAPDHDGDGGSAFPGENDSDKQYNWVSRGMTLRDWFAGQALVAMIRVSLPEDGEDKRMLAERAYEQADAMLKARQ